MAQRCKAKSKTTQEQCKQYAVRGREVCRYHGGLSHPAGPTNPNYVHGMYSKALPANMRDLAEHSARDENNIALNQAIGALDARLVQLMEGLSRETGGKQAWREIRQIIDALHEFHETEQPVRFNQTLDRAKDVLSKQFREFSIWEEIYNGFEVRRRLVETETKRRDKAANQLSLDQAMTFTHQVAIAIRRHVDDPKTLRMIALDLNAIMNNNLGSPLMNQVNPPTETVMVEVETDDGR